MSEAGRDRRPGRTGCALPVGAQRRRVPPYHDEEWGQPVRDDAGIFERLSLEAFQSGLSWLTILRKRENFRAAFARFDPAQVAAFGAGDTERLLADGSGIVRNRAKIEGGDRQRPGHAGGSRRPGRAGVALLAEAHRPARWPRRPTSRRGHRPPRRAPRNCGGSGSPSPARSRSTRCPAGLRVVDDHLMRLLPPGCVFMNIHGRDVRPAVRESHVACRD